MQYSLFPAMNNTEFMILEGFSIDSSIFFLFFFKEGHVEHIMFYIIKI